MLHTSPPAEALAAGNINWRRELAAGRRGLVWTSWQETKEFGLVEVHEAFLFVLSTECILTKTRAS